MQWLSETPPLFVAFFATVLLGFVIGLEVHSYRRANQQGLGFGTTRTITLMALSGFALAVLDPGLHLFGIGYAVLAAFLGLQYWKRLADDEQSLLPSLIALLTYPIGPIALLHNLWLLLLYVVAILLLLGGKPGIRRLSDQVHTQETITLAKFMIMAGLILPMLPDQAIAPGLAVSWNQLWLAVIAVSGISYLGYLVQTYFLPAGGILLSGLLGGLYSSTAATVVLARQAQDSDNAADQPYASAVILASAMMYGRLLVLVLVLGHFPIAWRLAPPFALAVAMALGSAWLVRPSRKKTPTDPVPDGKPSIRHPLEFSTAVLFAGLFVFFAFATQVVVSRYGAAGLHWLAFLVGFSDIDPFILSLLDGHYTVTENTVSQAILIATASNNLLKALYAIVLTRKANMLRATLALCLISIVSLCYVFFE